MTQPRIAPKLVYAFVALLALAPRGAWAAADAEKVTSGSGPSDSPSGDSAQEQRRANHIEGHIAFLKAELMVTASQEDAWSKVADAMRDDVTEYEQMATKYPQSQTEPTALQSLNERGDFAGLRAKGEVRFLAAFNPLYASFSPRQKQVADDLFASHDDE